MPIRTVQFAGLRTRGSEVEDERGHHLSVTLRFHVIVEVTRPGGRVNPRLEFAGEAVLVGASALADARGTRFAGPID